MSEENLHEVEITVKAPKGEDGERTILPDLEKLPAVVKSIKPKETKKGQRANFCFELKGDYKGEYAWGSVPMREVLSEDSYLYQWSASILGKTFDIGDNFKLGQLVGKPVYIIIENTPSDDEEKPYQNVVKVLAREASDIDEEEVEETEPVTSEEIDDSLTEESISSDSEEDDEDEDFDLFD